MHQTPWVKKNSSLPSDRIRPTYQQQSSSKPKGKNPQLQSSVPKSKVVKNLETQLKALQSSNGANKDPKGGCYCQAREHVLSSYTPICRHCGLILCEINLPHYACPDCTTPMLAAAQRASLLTKIEVQIADTLAKEAAERERLAEAARQAAGSFPTLSGAPPRPNGGLSATPVTQQTHKVLSLNSKTKKATIATYSPSPRPSPTATPPPEEPEDEIVRVPPPPAPSSLPNATLDASRPWKNLRGENLKYIPIPVTGVKSKSRRQRGKGKKAEIGGPSQ